jgi:hypothetical protein
MESLFVLISSIGIITVVGVYFFWKIPLNCPKCHANLIKEKIDDEDYLICKKCGHQEKG